MPAPGSASCPDGGSAGNVAAGAARAILHDPRILILNSSASGVDTEPERQIQPASDRWVSGRATFAIARTRTAADKLVASDPGAVAEEGTHDGLVHKDGGIGGELHQTQAARASPVGVP